MSVLISLDYKLFFNESFSSFTYFMNVFFSAPKKSVCTVMPKSAALIEFFVPYSIILKMREMYVMFQL